MLFSAHPGHFSFTAASIRVPQGVGKAHRHLPANRAEAHTHGPLRTGCREALRSHGILQSLRWPTEGIAHAKRWKFCVEAFEKSGVAVTQQRLGPTRAGSGWSGSVFTICSECASRWRYSPATHPSLTPTGVSWGNESISLAPITLQTPAPKLCMSVISRCEIRGQTATVTSRHVPSPKVVL